MNKKLEPMMYAIFTTLGLLSMQFKSPFFDSDILWSMAIGKWIADNKSFPVVDSFSWTIYGKEWITHEWLYCLGAYKMYAIWGNIGFYVLAFIPIAITIYVLYLICKKFDHNNSYAFLFVLTIGSLLLFVFSSPFRAYVYAMAFFTILIYLLYFKDKSKLDGLHYALLFIVWANFHSSVCMGIIILTVEMIRQMVLSRKVHGLFIIVTSMLSTLINPYTYKVWTYFLFALSTGETRGIAEWRAPDFNDPSRLVLYLIIASSVILLQFDHLKNLTSREAGTDLESEEVRSENKSVFNVLCRYWEMFSAFVKKRISVVTCLLVLFWGFYIYSLYSIRMLFYAIILWIIVTGFYVGLNRNLNFTRRTYYLIVGLFTVLFAVNLATANPISQNIVEFEKKISPVEEVRFIMENPEYQTHLFNSYLFGGYLILNDIPVFIDARSDSYIKFGIQKSYGAIVSLEEDPQQLLDEYAVKNIIINKDTALDRYLTINTKWRLVNEGPTACVFTRIVDNQNSR